MNESIDDMFRRRVGAEGWGLKGGGLKSGGPKISPLFSLSPSHFLSLSRGLLVECRCCLKRRDPQMCTFGVLGLSCETPAPRRPSGKKTREIFGGLAEGGSRGGVRRRGARRRGVRRRRVWRRGSWKGGVREGVPKTTRTQGTRKIAQNKEKKGWTTKGLYIREGQEWISGKVNGPKSGPTWVGRPKSVGLMSCRA